MGREGPLALGPALDRAFIPTLPLLAVCEHFVSLGLFLALHKGNRSTSRAQMIGSVTCDGPMGHIITSIAVPASPTP